MDCTDVGIEPLAALLDRAIVLVQRLVLSPSTNVELLLSDECNQCVAALKDDEKLA